MKAKVLLTLTAFAIPFGAITARANCGQPDCPMITKTANADESAALMEPVRSVLDNYLKIESALAKDSIEGVSSNASAIATAVRGDSMNMLSRNIAEQADALAKAKDLRVAREALKPLSASLISYLHDHHVTGAYTEVYCPMAKASWLQKGEKVENPYMEPSMRGCGEIKSPTHQNTT